jgi:putative endonuclease
MPCDYNFWVSIVTNRNRSVPYIGVTNRLSRRSWEHREGAKVGFAAKYKCKKLILLRALSRHPRRLAREWQLNKWSRAKKISLINRLNSQWDDLGADVRQDRQIQGFDSLTSRSLSLRPPRPCRGFPSRFIFN